MNRFAVWGQRSYVELLRGGGRDCTGDEAKQAHDLNIDQHLHVHTLLKITCISKLFKNVFPSAQARPTDALHHLVIIIIIIIVAARVVTDRQTHTHTHARTHAHTHTHMHTHLLLVSCPDPTHNTGEGLLGCAESACSGFG